MADERKAPIDFRRRMAAFEADAEEEEENGRGAEEDPNLGELPSTSTWKDSQPPDASASQAPLDIPRLNIAGRASELGKWSKPPRLTLTVGEALRPKNSAATNAAVLARSRGSHLESTTTDRVVTPEVVRGRFYPRSQLPTSPPPDPTAHIFYPPTSNRRRLINDEWDNVDKACMPTRAKKEPRQRRRKEDCEGYDAEKDRFATAAELLGLGAAKEGKEAKKSAPEKDPHEAAIEAEIIESGGDGPDWSAVIGLEETKKALHYAAIYPLKFPQHFQGLRAPARGVLLYGPPGTGKTMLARCLAAQASATFINISASSLFSKWIGEGERLIRALFAVARRRAPSIIFMDEVDGLLSQRNAGGSGGGEAETVLRMKNEFLAAMDGIGSGGQELLLVLGATNLPQSLDPAARRRFPRRIYIPLPAAPARAEILKTQLRSVACDISDAEFAAAAAEAEGYSGSDLLHVAKAAAMGPMNRLFEGEASTQTLEFAEPGPVNLGDLRGALARSKASVDPASLAVFEDFQRLYGAE